MNLTAEDAEMKCPTYPTCPTCPMIAVIFAFGCKISSKYAVILEYRKKTKKTKKVLAMFWAFCYNYTSLTKHP